MRLPIELDKFQEEILSPEKFLNLNDAERANIEYSEIIPPKIGSKDFGFIKVQYKSPVYMRPK